LPLTILDIETRHFRTAYFKNGRPEIETWRRWGPQRAIWDGD
jgi:hypothetical protein